VAIGQRDVGIHDSQEVTCPLCESVFDARRWLVLDLDHRPVLFAHILDGSLQRGYCPRCLGPGVDLGGAFLMARRGAQALEVVNCVPGKDQIEVIEVAHRRLRERLDALGETGTRIDVVGSRMFRRLDDVEPFMEECWPDFSANHFDSEMLAGPLSWALSASRIPDQAAILLAYRDLARPNIEVLLGHFASQNDERGSRAQELRSLIDLARRHGIEAAQATEERRRAVIPNALAKLTPALKERVRRFFEIDPNDPELFDSQVQAGQRLAQALRAAGAEDYAANVLACLGDLHRRRADLRQAGHAEQAIACYREALALIAADDADTQWKVLLSLSGCWDNRIEGERARNVEEALACAGQAVALAAELPRERLAEALMELGSLYTRRPDGDLTSNLSLARENLERAVELAAGIHELRRMARYNLALTYVEDSSDRTGRGLDRGIAMLREWARLPDIGDFFDPRQQQNLLQSLAAALAQRAESTAGEAAALLDEAAACAARAHALATARGSVAEAARLASVRATIETDRLRAGGAPRIGLREILRLFDEAAQVFTPDAAPYEYARNEIRRAGTFLELLDPRIAGPMARQTLERVAQVMTPEVYPDMCRRVQAQLGALYMKAFDWQDAAAAYRLACEASERLLVWAETPGQRGYQAEPNALLYERWVDALTRQHDELEDGEASADDRRDIAWQVLEAMERGRARLYLDTMALRPLPALPGVAPEWIAREAELIAQLAWTVTALGSEGYAVVAPERLARVRAARSELESLWDRIARGGEDGQRHVAMRRIRLPGRSSLAALADALGERVACLSFFVLDRCIVAVWLTQGGAPLVHCVDVPVEELQAQVIASFEGDVLADPPPVTPRHAWMDFGDRLLGPFAERLAALDLLVLVPHARLHGLPLHALTVQGQPLIARVAVAYAPSLAVLASVRAAAARAPERGSPLVGSHAGDPRDREEFETEARRVAGLNRAVMRPRLRRSVLRAVAPTAPLIHLACHGRFDTADPLQSGVGLADGLWSAHDWLALRLCSDLVTLSACETGRQSAGRGDELLGLARAVLQAGSSSVLLSLWRIYSDTTVEWMERFYTERAKPGRWADAAAFRSATLALRASDPDPVAWAAFMLAGNPG
jgi:CHAT domain-containing protein